MKLISLNIWGGRESKELLNFLAAHEEVDIFCLQEVYDNARGKEVVYLDVSFNIYNEISQVLKNYTGYYRPHLADYYGLAVFVKKGLSISEDEIYVHLEKGYVPVEHVGFHAKNLQYLKFKLSGRDFTIVNFHGLWAGPGVGKGDTSARVEQAKNIKNFLNQQIGEKIICGDFNMLPDTQSIEILEKDMNNLIKINNIISTRTILYSKPERLADYILTSKGVVAKSFEVLSDVVSDHSPLYLDFE
jgi:exonuclease III